MKKVEKCVVENCIPTPTSCVTWSGPDVPSLGICSGDKLNPLLNDIVIEIQKLMGTDFSKFSVDSLLKICGKDKPETINLMSIFTLLRDNNLCLKVFIDELDAQLSTLLAGTTVDVNLKCYTGFNKLGLTVTREQFDQLVIDILCSHKGSIDSIDSSILRMQEAINTARNSMTIQEVLVSTCTNTESLPLSEQVKNTTKELCDFEIATGNATDINSALAKTPTDLNLEFGGIAGWKSSPSNFADNYGNTLLEVEDLRQRVTTIEETCCKVTCKDFTIGYTAIFNEDATGILITFTAAAGTILPKGFEDCGSAGSITDSKGNTQYFDISISTNTSVEIPLIGMVAGDIYVNISSKICNTDKNLVCQDCINKTVAGTDCPTSPVCKVTVTGDTGSYIDIVYLLQGSYTSIRISAGQYNYIPTEATVVGIERVGGAVESSDCLDLTEIQEKKCYFLTWAVTDNGNPQTEAWDNYSAIQRITSYNVLGTTYILGSDIYDPDAVIAAISTNGYVNSLITDLTAISTPIADLYAKGFSFKTIPAVADSLYLFTDGEVAGVTKIKIFATEYECGTSPVIPGS